MSNVDFVEATEDLPPKVVVNLMEVYARNPQILTTLIIASIIRRARQKRAVSKTPSHTYFIGRADGSVKIGAASRPADRLAGLQTGSPERLRILAVIPGGYAVERQMHERFAGSRMNGEWFRPTPDLLAYIASVRDP